MSKLKVNSIESLTSTGISVATGTAGGPSLVFGGDDSGIFGDGNNTVGISTGGSVRLQANDGGVLVSGTLQASGNVSFSGGTISDATISNGTVSPTVLVISSSSGTGVDGTMWLT